MEIQLGLESQKEVPPEIRGWNWGAFLLTWIWGICNGTLLSLLSLIPGVHFIMMFVLGFKGNEWAWKNKEWESVDEFHRVQRKWASWALAVWLIGGALCIVVPLGILGWGISTEMPGIKSMVADFAPQRKYCNYALSMAEQEPMYRNSLGGRLEVTGAAQAKVNENGYVDVSVPVRNAHGQGHLYVRTRKEGATESLERVELDLNNLERIPVKTVKDENLIRNFENRIVSLVAAQRLSNQWKNRDPRGKEEAEELYRSTLHRIESDPNVRQLLGSEIQTRVEHASISMEGPGGDAEVTVLAKGNGLSATINMRFNRVLGRWELADARLESGGKVLNF